MLEEWSVGDESLTLQYYATNDDPWRMIDLNGDGVDEAICEAYYAVFEPGKPQYIGGATGNGPRFIFQQIDQQWYRIADLSGVSYEILDKKVNDWPVLLSTWHLGGPETGTAVYVFEGDRYKPVHQYEEHPVAE